MRRDEFPLVEKHVKNEVNAVLDKIRAEINEVIKVDPYRLYAAIEIIDKYRGEQS